MLYKCTKCGYEVNHKSTYVAHISRVYPCDLVRDNDWVINNQKEKYQERLEKLTSYITTINETESIDDFDAIIKNIKKEVKCIKQLARLLDISSDDVDTIKNTLTDEMNANYKRIRALDVNTKLQSLKL